MTDDRHRRTDDDPVRPIPSARPVGEPINPIDDSPPTERIDPVPSFETGSAGDDSPAQGRHARKTRRHKK